MRPNSPQAVQRFHVAVDIESDFGEVIPLPEIMRQAMPFEMDLLEPQLREFVRDTSERLQCQPDFIAAPLMVVLGALIGRKVQIAPKAKDEWHVVPNLWGAIVGRPGALKSPALSEALRPLAELESESANAYQEKYQDYVSQEMAYEAHKKATQAKMLKAAKEGKDLSQLADDALHGKPDEPVCKRYIVNDPTTEKLGEVLQDNPNGVLVFRDESVGWMRSMDKQGRESDRAFYLETWNGNSGFTYDRIGRGTVRIESACVSFVGGIQPGALEKYQQDAVAGGKGDDGFMQRFQLLVCPEPLKTFTNVDREPNAEAYESYRSLCRWIDSLVGEQVVRFTPSAQQIFDAWRERLENRLRNEDMPAALESHLAKYRSLIPALALINHLASEAVSDVPDEPLLRAIAWGKYLESHANRVYSTAINKDIQAAHTLLEKLTAGAIPEEFTVRDVYINGWTGLKTPQAAKGAVNVLTQHNMLSERTLATGGRPKVEYVLNPEVRSESA